MTHWILAELSIKLMKTSMLGYRSSTMTAQVIVARQFDPSINRSAQCIAVVVNGLDATLVGRGAKVSVDLPNLRTSASTTIRRHYSSAVPWDASCVSESIGKGIY